VSNQNEAPVENLQQRLDEVLARHPADRSNLIPLLQDIQAEFGYIPADAMRATARFLRVPETAVYGVATFYAQFYLTRQGKHRVKVCQGTACHVRGGRSIMRAVKKKLGIGPGETTGDYKFSLERVACFGSCALSPVVVLDDKVYGRLTPQQAVELLEGVE
jgi:NADH-quinone oxidoreductase subunit E